METMTLDSVSSVYIGDPKLIDKKLVEVKKVKDFIELVNEISEVIQ